MYIQLHDTATLLADTNRKGCLTLWRSHPQGSSITMKRWKQSKCPQVRDGQLHCGSAIFQNSTKQSLQKRGKIYITIKECVKKDNIGAQPALLTD